MKLREANINNIARPPRFGCNRCVPSAGPLASLAMQRAAFCVLLLLGVALVGCRSSHPAVSSSDLCGEDTIPFALGPGDPPPTTPIGHIVRTNSLESGQMLLVDVYGHVNQPSRITVPKGTTALQAIKRAGGFDNISASHYLHIKRGGTTHAYKLATEALSPELPNHYLIWYGPYTWSNWRGREVVDRRARSDVVLQPGDLVLVPGAL
jgi:SLBB domain